MDKKETKQNSQSETRTYIKGKVLSVIFTLSLVAIIAVIGNVIIKYLVH